jgi:hypothetical protein
MIIRQPVNRTVVTFAAVIATVQGFFLWQLLVNTKPYKISLVASSFELAAVVGGVLGLVAAVLTAMATRKRFVALALPASAVMVPLAVLSVVALTVGFAPDPSGTPSDLSPAGARLNLFRQLWLLGLSSTALAVLLSAIQVAHMRRGTQAQADRQHFQRPGGDA